MMDIRQLRYFLAIVREGSFSRAAARIRVAQPALSLHVRKMEEALGTPLLLRSSGGVTPTEAGALLVRRAEAILNDLQRTEDEIRSLDREPSGSVRIGLTGTISGTFSVPLITRARELYPQIRITIAEAMSGFVRDWLRDGKVDLALLYAVGEGGGLEAEALLEEELVIISAPHSPARGYILPSGTHGLRQMIDQRLGERPDPVIEIDSYSNIKALVIEGYGRSILPFHAVAEEVSQGRLSAEPFPSPGFWRTSHLVHVPARPMTAATDAIADLTRRLATEFVDRQIWAGTRPVSQPAARR